MSTEQSNNSEQNKKNIAPCVYHHVEYYDKDTKKKLKRHATMVFSYDLGGNIRYGASIHFNKSPELMEPLCKKGLTKTATERYNRLPLFVKIDMDLLENLTKKDKYYAICAYVRESLRKHGVQADRKKSKHMGQSESEPEPESNSVSLSC